MWLGDAFKGKPHGVLLLRDHHLRGQKRLVASRPSTKQGTPGGPGEL